MRLIAVSIIIILGTASKAQNKLNTGFGYFDENLNAPGFILEFEYEPYYTKDLSLPWRSDIIYFFSPEYNVFLFDVHKGFRRYLNSGLYFEQSVGIGVMTTYYKVDGIFYFDKFGNSTRFKQGANWSITPSVSAGIGYKLMKNKNDRTLLWCRPKIYWNLGFRGLNEPYFGLQAGLTYNIKNSDR